MGVRNFLSSFRKKYINPRHWMDVDGMTSNARHVGNLFKDLQQVSKSKKYDEKLTFEGWLLSNHITDDALAAYTRRVFYFLIGYLVLVVLLASYMIYFFYSARIVVGIYVGFLSFAALLYSFKQYMVWVLLKKRKMKCSVKEALCFTKSLFCK